MKGLIGGLGVLTVLFLLADCSLVGVCHNDDECVTVCVQPDYGNPYEECLAEEDAEVLVADHGAYLGNCVDQQGGDPDSPGVTVTDDGDWVMVPQDDAGADGDADADADADGDADADADADADGDADADADGDADADADGDADGDADADADADGDADGDSDADADGDGDTDDDQEECREGKVLICHVPKGNPENAHNLCVGAPAVNAHLSHHGDYLGGCR